MKNTRWTILAALVMAASSVAQAQPVGGPPTGFVPPTGPPTGFSGAPGGFSGAPSGAIPGGSIPGGSTVGGASADSGAVSNADSTITSTTTSSSGIGPDGASIELEPSGDTTALPNSGGEPVIMTLIGLSVALGAFALRKRVSA